MASNPRISLIIQAEGANEALKSLRQLQAEMQKELKKTPEQKAEEKYGEWKDRKD